MDIYIHIPLFFGVSAYSISVYVAFMHHKTEVNIHVYMT